MNPEIKSLFASKTVWGVVIAALPTVLAVFGYKVSDVAAFSAGADRRMRGCMHVMKELLSKDWLRKEAVSRNDRKQRKNLKWQGHCSWAIVPMLSCVCTRTP